ncbi:MAG: CinA family nicotinamide mononucleotide deamidase-related protein [Bacteroidales bacterium]|nr:CinA family nicotinamide mononucleotide deamidase-related protein [Bacteroidales bacterium]
MKASIINIGDELLIGQVVNTNAARMAQMLTAAGIDVVQTLVCPDRGSAIADSLRLSLSMADAVLVTGGLGPTKDDVTKHTLCQLTGSHLVENADALANVQRIFARRGYPMTESNRSQADVPHTCEVIVNTMGTAPCMWFDRSHCANSLLDDDKVIVAMPGVPFEMEHLMQHCIVQRLRTHFHLGAIATRNVLVQGIGESFLSDLIEPWELSLPDNLKLAYLPVAGMVKLRLTAHGDSFDQLNTLIDQHLSRLYPLAAQYIVGENRETLQELVSDRFHANHKTLSIAESCTGGAIAAGLTALAGASDYLKGGVVAYSNEVKAGVLGVKTATLDEHGAVSEATVREMVEGVRQRLHADVAIATTGIAGPGGGTESKPVGTVWIGLADGNRTLAKCMHYSGPRQQIIDRTCNEAYAWLLREIQ